MSPDPPPRYAPSPDDEIALFSAFLGQWIEDDRVAIATLGHLRDAAANWIELNRDPGALYRGARLELALDASAARSTELPGDEREFLDASREARDTEQREAAERVDRQARANRRLRIQLAAIGVALAVALVGGFVALDQRRDAQRRQRVATARELAAASAANIDVDPERSMLLALAAVDQTRSSDGIVLPEAEEALHRAVSASRILASFPGVGGSVDWSPDGTMFVHEGQDNSGLIDIRDAETGESVRSFRGHDVDVNMVAFGGDGSLLATTGDDGALRVWDPNTGEQLLEFVDHQRADVRGPSFSADGSRVIATWVSGRVRVIDVATGGLISEISELPGSGAMSASLSPDGSRVAVGHESFVEPAVTVFDATTGTKLFTLRGDHDDINSLAWSPDGRWIAAGSFWVSEVGVWNAETHEQRFTLTGHTGATMDWSPDSSRLATGGDDGRSLVTEITDAGIREVFAFSVQNNSGGLAGVAFSPDGQRLMTGNLGITAVTVWDVSPTAGGELATVEGVEPFGIAHPFDYLPDDHEVAVAQADGSVSIADVVTGAQRASIPGDGPVASLDVSDDGQLLATASLSTVEVRDTSTGELRFAIPAGDAPRGLEWSPNSDVLAAIDNRGQPHVVIVDRSGVEVTRLPEAPGHFVESIGFSPDGRLLATARVGLGLARVGGQLGLHRLR